MLEEEISKQNGLISNLENILVQLHESHKELEVRAQEGFMRTDKIEVSFNQKLQDQLKIVFEEKKLT
jgi:hypothetical protein